MTITAPATSVVIAEPISDLTDMLDELIADISSRAANTFSVIAPQVFLGQHEVIVASNDIQPRYCEVVVTSALNIALRVDGDVTNDFDGIEAGLEALEFAEANLVSLSLIAGLQDEIAARR